MNVHFVNSASDWLKGKRPHIPAIGRLVLAVLVSTSLSYGYTVLTHEAIIDSVWDTTVRKLLLKRFPGATPEELEQAHAYAYGGCIIQDMGYYPFSSRFFSDLTHYVRSGDFIVALIRESQDLNEYAFALGALEHLNGYSGSVTIQTLPWVSRRTATMRLPPNAAFSMALPGGARPMTRAGPAGRLVAASTGWAYNSPSLRENEYSFVPSADVEQYRRGKPQVIGFLVGQVMKASGGQADPAAVNRMLKEKLG